MTIILNGNLFQLDENTTIESLIKKMNAPQTGIAVAKNFEVVPKTEWHETKLSENDILEVIQAVQGG